MEKNILGNLVGRCIKISGNKVIIDGKDVTPDSKEINIEIQGDIELLDVDYCEIIHVKGTVNKINIGSGDIRCDDVSGDIQIGSGDVDCENVQGNIRTGSGDVSYRR